METILILIYALFTMNTTTSETETSPEENPVETTSEKAQEDGGILIGLELPPKAN